MNNNEFAKLIEQEKITIDNLMEVKGSDYSEGDVDRLGNFKEDALATGLTKYQVWSILFNKHVKSVMRAIRQNPNNPSTRSEAIQGRLRDIIVYCLLKIAMLEEDKPKPIVRTVTKEKVPGLTSLIKSHIDPVIGIGADKLFYALGLGHIIQVCVRKASMETGGMTFYQAKCICGFTGTEVIAFELANDEAMRHWIAQETSHSTPYEYKLIRTPKENMEKPTDVQF